MSCQKVKNPINWMTFGSDRRRQSSMFAASNRCGPITSFDTADSQITPHTTCILSTHLSSVFDRRSNRSTCSMVSGRTCPSVSGRNTYSRPETAQTTPNTREGSGFQTKACNNYFMSETFYIRLHATQSDT